MKNEQSDIQIEAFNKLKNSSDCLNHLSRTDSQ